MYRATVNQPAKEDYGKCICVSVPYHQLELIEDMDIMAHFNRCSSRSDFLRKLAIDEKRKIKEKYGSNWKTILGAN